MIKRISIVTIFILFSPGVYCQAPFGRDSVNEKNFGVAISISPSFQFFTNNRDKIVGHSFSMEYPALTLSYRKLMICAAGVSGGGTSNIDIKRDDKTFTPAGGYLNFFQIKLLVGYTALKNRRFSLTPYWGVMYGEMVGEKEPIGSDSGSNKARLFPNYMLGTFVNYDLTGDLNKCGIRHFVRLNIGYSFLNIHSPQNSDLNSGLPVRMKEVGLGWGLYLD